MRAALDRLTAETAAAHLGFRSPVGLRSPVFVHAEAGSSIGC